MLLPEARLCFLLESRPAASGPLVHALASGSRRLSIGPCPFAKPDPEFPDRLVDPEPLVAVERGKRRSHADVARPILDRGSCDLSEQPQLAPDAAANNQRPVVALPLEPSAHEHGRIVVRERAQQRGEQPEIHHSPRGLTSLITNKPCEHQAGQLNGPGFREQRLPGQRRDLPCVP
jgi:hypothetical protein